MMLHNGIEFWEAPPRPETRIESTAKHRTHVFSKLLMSMSALAVTAFRSGCKKPSAFAGSAMVA